MRAMTTRFKKYRVVYDATRVKQMAFIVTVKDPEEPLFFSSQVIIETFSNKHDAEDCVKRWNEEKWNEESDCHDD